MGNVDFSMGQGISAPNTIIFIVEQKMFTAESILNKINFDPILHTSLSTVDPFRSYFL